MEIASGPSEENKKDENMEELDKTYVKLSHDDAPGKGKLNKGIYYICGSIFVVGLIFFFFLVSNSLSNIIIPKNKRKSNLN